MRWANQPMFGRTLRMAAHVAAGLVYVGLNLFLMWLRLVYPSIRKSKTTQDVCNVCSRLDLDIDSVKQQLKAARGEKEEARLDARLEDLTKQRERHLGPASETPRSGVRLRTPGLIN
eukprot:gene9458-biopygen1678